jgi:hypothetical protein
MRTCVFLGTSVRRILLPLAMVTTRVARIAARSRQGERGALLKGAQSLSNPAYDAMSATLHCHAMRSDGVRSDAAMDAFLTEIHRYERPLAGAREQTKDERAMQHFQSRLERQGSQCVRYAYSSDDFIWPVRISDRFFLSPI